MTADREKAPRPTGQAAGRATGPGSGRTPSSGRTDAAPTAGQLASVEAVVADGALTPRQKLDRLTAWDDEHGTARPEGHGRVADAGTLGLPDPAPYSAEVQRAIVELYNRHRADLPPPEAAAWTAAKGRGGRR